MEQQAEKIKRFSKVIYILLNIAFVASIVVSALAAVALLWSVLGMNTETVNVNGVAMEFPLLFKLGSVNVALPIAWRSDIDILRMSFSLPEAGFTYLLRIILTLVGIRYTKSVFKLLKADGTPFRAEIVTALRKLAVALLLVGVVSGAVPFLAAGIVWALCLIFDYGLALQSESDTTI